MDLLSKIKQRYFSGISVKMFLIAKTAIALFLLFNVFPQILTFSISGQQVDFIPVVGIILVLIISSSYHKMLAQPLIEINKTAAKIARLDFSTKCDVKSNDELGEMSRNLNLISRKLNSTITKLERELDKKEILLKSQRELSDGLSHEMKTPLGIIKAYAEGIKDNISPARQEQYINTIIRESDRMNNLIVELLNLSAMETGAIPLKITSFDLVELIEEVAGRLLIDSAERQFELSCHLGNKRVELKADRDKMEQALSNLITNAYKYVADNGEIKLTVKKGPDSIRVEIYNSGGLIPEDKIPYLWKRFYRLDRSRDKKTGGSGLGLATVAQILSMHGFTYGVKNEKQGVTFYILIRK